MKIIEKDVLIEGRKVKAKITLKEIGDRELIKRLYFDWKQLNDRLKKISTRGINLPEAISENAFTLFYPECVRVVNLKGMKCSFDCINLKTGSRIQIKASSVISDLTSFGPRSEWDELFFLDFSSGDGSFKIYKIEQDFNKWKIYSIELSNIGLKNGQNKLVDSDIFPILDRIHNGENMSQIAREYNVNPSLIHSIKVGKLYSRITGIQYKK
jgi:hypothetical protein